MLLRVDAAADDDPQETYPGSMAGVPNRLLPGHGSTAASDTDRFLLGAVAESLNRFTFSSG